MIDESPYELAVAEAAAYANLTDLLTEQAVARPDAEAAVQALPERRSLTWAALDRQVGGVARGLNQRGLVAGHRVGLLGPNRLEFVVAYLAVLRAGLVAVPVDPDLEPPERNSMLRHCGVAAVLTAEGLADVEGPSLPLTPAGLSDLAERGSDPVTSPRDPEALAALVYTAGTTGDPKAVMLSHRALLAQAEHTAALDIIGPGTTVLAALPFFGVFGLNAVLGGWLRSGARMVVMDGFDGFFDVVHREEVTNLPTAPALLSRIGHDERATTHLTSVTTVVCGGAALPEEVREEFGARTRLRVDLGYGLTEAAGGVSTTVGGRLLGHGHVGRPLPGVEVRIGGGDGDEPGEIEIRGANLFSGYWPDGSGGPGPDGWFATGDVGYLRDGELFLLDRAQELISVSGFHVYPVEVEEAILELPEVESVAVLGRRDSGTGSQVVAFVTGSSLTPETVAAHCAERLAKFKRPAVVVVVDALPRGATGQVQKGRLRGTLPAEGVS
ncbi:MAG TPA: class I adenylate-forming enzyme family protein [Propionibacteriaceae bacterium]|nr:class I adenylate-forming enzyme family protein [Propionibacteriaceae bacterium]